MLYLMCSMIIAVSITTAAILIKGASYSEDIENEESSRKLKNLAESFIAEEKTKDDKEAKRKKDAVEKAIFLFFLKNSNNSNC